MLLLAMAWRRIRRLSFSAAARLIDTAAQLRDSLVAAGQLDVQDATTLDHHLRHRRIMLAAAQDDLGQVEREAELPYAVLAMVTDYDAWRDSVAGVEAAEWGWRTCALARRTPMSISFSTGE